MQDRSDIGADDPASRGIDSPAIKESTRALASGTARLTLASAAVVVFQAVYFVLVARALGVTSFGALAASLALVGILVPFATWGSGNMLVMEVARDPRSLSVSFGNTLVALGISGVVLLGLALGVGAVLLPDVPLAAILLLGVADLGFARVVEVAKQCFLALDRLVAVAWISTLLPAVRCAVAGLFVAVWASDDLVTWTALYLGATVLAATVAFWSVTRRLGRPSPRRGMIGRRVRIGGYFAVSASASTIYNDIDRVMLARLATLDATGIYAAAYRAAGLAHVPLMALLTVTYPSFFRAGRVGIQGSSAYARRLLVPAVLYGLVAGIAIYALAPLAPILLGEDYGDSVEALRWLAPLPVLAALGYLPADALTGADAQGLRTLLQVAAAALNVVLCALLIPAHSWRGAAWATLVTLSVLALSLWLATAYLQRGQSLRAPRLGETG